MNRNDILTKIIIPILCAFIGAVGGFLGGKTIEKLSVNNNISQSGITNNINYSLSNEDPLAALINAYIELSNQNKDLNLELASLKAEADYPINGITDNKVSLSEDFNAINAAESKENPEADVSDWMDQCQPFLLDGSAGKDLRKVYLNEGKSFTAGGKTFYKGFTLYSSGNNFASFNLEGKYSSVEFYVGHVSGNIYGNTLEMEIYVDGKYYDTFLIDMTDAARKIEIPLNYALSMKIAIKGQCGVVGFGRGHFFE